MINFDIWQILGIITIILLAVFWKKKNAVWGGLTLGIIIGIIIAIFSVLKGNGFDWYVIGKSATLGTILGFVAELLGRGADLLKKE